MYHSTVSTTSASRRSGFQSSRRVTSQAAAAFCTGRKPTSIAAAGGDTALARIEQIDGEMLERLALGADFVDAERRGGGKGKTAGRVRLKPGSLAVGIADLQRFAGPGRLKSDRLTGLDRRHFERPGDCLPGNRAR